MNERAKAHPTNEIREGTTVEIPFTVSQSDMDAFARLSGDSNPLHSDSTFARDRGFDGPVVFGGLIVSVVSRLLGTRVPGPGCVWHSLEIDFRSPLYVNEPASLTGTVTYCNNDIGVARLAIEIRFRDAVAASGQAQVSFGRGQS